MKLPPLGKGSFELWANKASFQKEAEPEPRDVKFWQWGSLDTIMPESSATPVFPTRVNQNSPFGV